MTGEQSESKSKKRVVLYPWQARAIQECQPQGDLRWFAWFCGTGSGKTYAGAVWALQQHVATAQRLRALFGTRGNRRIRPLGMILAPTLESLRRNALGALAEITEGTCYAGRYYENRHEYRFSSIAGGGAAVCASLDNKEAIKRAEGGQYDYLWVDEAAMTPEAAYVLIRSRSAMRRAAVLLTSYWYAPINWCYRKVWKPWEAGDPSIRVINLPTTVNPDYPVAEVEAARRTLDSALFEMRYRGKPTRMIGLVFGESWDPADKELHCEPFDLPVDWRVMVGGVDQGYSPSPFHLVLGAEDPESGVLYLFAEYVSLATTTHEKAIGIVRLLLKRVPEATSRHFDLWGDPSNPQGLSDLRYEFARVKPEEGTVRLDISVHSADNAVESGIEAVTAAFRAKRLRVMRGRCPVLVEQFGLYCRDANGNIVKADDHGPDATRYLVYTRKRSRHRAGVV